MTPLFFVSPDFVARTHKARSLIYQGYLTIQVFDTEHKTKYIDYPLTAYVGEGYDSHGDQHQWLMHASRVYGTIHVQDIPAPCLSCGVNDRQVNTECLECSLAYGQ